jgi:hypothetical protein
MSSIGRSIAQVPSNNFVTILASGNIVDASRIATQFSSANTQRVGSNFLLVDTIDNLESNVEAFISVGTSVGAVGKTVKDLGLDLIIGLQGGESKLITFRLVQVSTDNENFGNTAVGYVCVENKIPGTVTCNVLVARV